MKQLYIVFDNVAGDASPLMPIRSDGLALRYFGSMLAQSKQSPSDYDLYSVGTCDDADPATVPIYTFATPRHIKNGAAVEINPVSLPEEDVNG